MVETCRCVPRPNPHHCRLTRGPGMETTPIRDREPRVSLLSLVGQYLRLSILGKDQRIRDKRWLSFCKYHLQRCTSRSVRVLVEPYRRQRRIRTKCAPIWSCLWTEEAREPPLQPFGSANLTFPYHHEFPTS